MLYLLNALFFQFEKLTSYLVGFDLFVYRIGPKRKLTEIQKKILIDQNDFYNKLNTKHQNYFEHRLSTFIRSYDFIGRGGHEINEETRVLIGSSYIMLTFGKKDYLTDVFSRIIVYPTQFLSTSTNRKHKGEFNPKMKAVVFSWQDFLKGDQISNDNINLGIHEFTHVIHLKSKVKKDYSSQVFREGYFQLLRYLKKNPEVRKEIIQSEYFRIYAFENQYEFMAVLLENFMETPEEFKERFPRIYSKIKRMLNFHFLQY